MNTHVEEVVPGEKLDTLADITADGLEFDNLETEASRCFTWSD